MQKPSEPAGMLAPGELASALSMATAFGVSTLLATDAK